jgi:transposase
LNVVEQRYQAVLEVLDGTPVTEVAQRFGVTVEPGITIAAARTIGRDIRRHKASDYSRDR